MRSQRSLSASGQPPGHLRLVDRDGWDSRSFPADTFVGVALRLIADAEVEGKVQGRRSSRPRDYRQRLNAYCIPFFGEALIVEIDHRRLKAFQLWLIKERALSGSTVLTIMSFVSMVLRLAADEGIITSLPRVPRPRQKDRPRPGFSWTEYQRLLAGIRRLESANPPVMVRAWPITSELREFTVFMVNSFLRPGDAIALRHRDVEVKISAQGTAYLKLTPPTSKTVMNPVVTMPKAVAVYEKLRTRANAADMAGPNDYVFMPERKRRAFAMEIMRRQFVHVLELQGLAKTSLGESRTLYSLRHTAIMFRLLHGDVDLLTLARTCRTSVEMIDRFYARSLHAEMNVDRLHSMRISADRAHGIG
jgi:integrase